MSYKVWGLGQGPWIQTKILQLNRIIKIMKKMFQLNIHTIYNFYTRITNHESKPNTSHWNYDKYFKIIFINDGSVKK